MGYDENAQPVTTTLAEYLLPTAAEVPNFEIIHSAHPSTLNPLGIKGIGEAGTVPVAAAIISAVEHAARALRRAHRRGADLTGPIDRADRGREARKLRFLVSAEQAPNRAAECIPQDTKPEAEARDRLCRDRFRARGLHAVSLGQVALRRSANWATNCEASAEIMPAPRPYWATEPESCRSVWISTLVSLPLGSRWNSTVASAPPRPFESLPEALTRARYPASSISSKRGGSVESQRHRTEPDRHFALVAGFVDDLGQLGAGHAGCDPLDVGQQGPGLVDGDGHLEGVLDLQFRIFPSLASRSAATRALMKTSRDTLNHAPETGSMLWLTASGGTP